VVGYGTKSRLSLVFGAIVLCFLVAGAVIVAGRTESPIQAAASAKSPTPSVITATVQHRVLTTEVVLRGNVTASGAEVIRAPTLPTGSHPVVTALNAKPGTTATPGDVLAVVAGRPVVTMPGAIQAYRTIAPGDVGSDVAELQSALTGIGYGVGSDPAGSYGFGTEQAVRAFYEALGYQPVLTNPSDDIDLTAAQDTVVAAQLLVGSDQLAVRAAADQAAAALAPTDPAAAARAATAAAAAQAAATQAAAAQAGVPQSGVSGTQSVIRKAATPVRGSIVLDVSRGSSAPVSAADFLPTTTSTSTAATSPTTDTAPVTVPSGTDAPPSTEPPTTAVTPNTAVPLNTGSPITAPTAVQIAVDQAALTKARTMLNTLENTTGAEVPLGEVVFVPTLPAKVVTVTAELGKSVGTGPLLSLGGDADVQASANGDQAVSLRTGEAAEIYDDLNGGHWDATITAVGATSSTQATGQPGTPSTSVTLSASKSDPIPLSELGVNVRVTVKGRTSGGPVFVVPISAVFATADGRSRVTVYTEGPARSHNDGMATKYHALFVRVGLNANGYVAVFPIGGKLTPGDQVVVGSNDAVDNQSGAPGT
jgi:hypothetical protein